jgi:2-C-methyl-D-erythritol 4-phosphate cytidylyltransferase/2-C-methyl-D-erythritol 2,4-cyclodiphosphate synthase
METDKLNIGLLLAAGYSTRFVTQDKTAKQLSNVNGKPVVGYSIDLMLKTLDKIVIVTNSKCFHQIINIVENNDSVTVIINDINDRVRTQLVGLKYIVENYNSSKIVIHDAARPFIDTTHITRLLELNETYCYSHFCLKLVNGLINLTTNEFIDRDNYVEACTPICINGDIVRTIVEENYEMVDKELFPIVLSLTDKYVFEYGDYHHLRKITTINDLVTI